jgi:hypothetical protein
MTTIRNTLIRMYGFEPFQTHDMLFGPPSEDRELLRRLFAELAPCKIQNVDERVAGTVIAQNMGPFGMKRARIGPTRRQGWAMLPDAGEGELVSLRGMPRVVTTELESRLSAIESRLTALESKS